MHAISAGKARLGATSGSRAGVLEPRRVVLGILIALPAAVTLFGLPYYLLDRAARARAPLHPLLRPSGPIGLGFGILGFALFLFLWLYPIRKRFRFLAFTGPIGRWLSSHVTAGLAIPLIVAVHAGWRFEGLIGLGYLSLLIVWLSGLVGRYLYARIPRSRSGVELSREETANERRALVTRIAAATGLAPEAVETALHLPSKEAESRGLWQALVGMVRDDWARGRAIRALRREWSRPRPGREPLSPQDLKTVLQLARHEIALDQQARMLTATHRVFALWHVAHRPFALTALIAVLIHVAVAIAVGVVGS